MKTCLFVCFLLASCQAFLTDFLSGNDAEWNALRVRCCSPSKDFFGLPVNVMDAVLDGWTKDTSAGSCDVLGNKFAGNRYRKNEDQAIMLLYDKSGYIAGMQAGIPKTESNYSVANNAKHHSLIEEDDMWVITAYFTPPEEICTKGREVNEFKKEGMGTMLAFQNGPSPRHLLYAPLNENDVVSTTKFIQGKCYPTMGMHYWYDISEDMRCDEVFPAFLLYNNKKLNGFGWAFTPYYNNSAIWEHGATFSPFIKEPPKCLAQNGEVSTLHIYLTDNPEKNYC